MLVRQGLLATLLASTVLAASLTGCSSESKITLKGDRETGTTTTGGTSGAGSTSSGTGGTGPKGNVDDPPADSPKDDRYTYQDDVVFVGGGEDAAVVAASSDGLTYELDGDAPGVSDLQKGSVLYVSPTLTGRVLELDKSGGDVVVGLGPVDLPEIFRDAVFDFTNEYDMSQTTFQAYPDFGPGLRDLPPDPEPAIGEDPPVDQPSTEGSTSDGSGSDSTLPDATTTAPSKLHGRARGGDTEHVTLPPLVVNLGAQPPRIDPNKRLPDKVKERTTFEAEGWSFSPYASQSAIGVEISRETDSKTKFSADVSLKFSRILLIVDTVISGGEYSKNTMKIEGIDGIAVDAAAGSAIGADGSLKIAMDVPVYDFRGVVPGQPFVYSLKTSIAVGAAFGGNNATISAGGRYKLNGPIGIENGTVVAPTLSTEVSLLDSILGLSLAPTGVTIGFGVTISAGLGIPTLFAGPFGKIAYDIGFANGSALGASLVRCKQVTVDLWAGGGVGFSVTSEVNKWLTKVLGPAAKIKGDAGVLANVFHRSALSPDSPICGGGGQSSPAQPSAGDETPN